MHLRMGMRMRLCAYMELIYMTWPGKSIAAFHAVYQLRRGAVSADSAH